MDDKGNKEEISILDIGEDDEIKNNGHKETIDNGFEDSCVFEDDPPVTESKDGGEENSHFVKTKHRTPYSVAFDENLPTSPHREDSTENEELMRKRNHSFYQDALPISPGKGSVSSDGFLRGSSRSSRSGSRQSSKSLIKPELDRPWYCIDYKCLPEKISYMIQEMRYAANLPYLFVLFTENDSSF